MAAIHELPNSQSEKKKPSSIECILERAIQVIEDGGEVAIRTNVIASECGVTPPILYRAYESREGLVIAAQAERYRRSMAIMTERLIFRIESSNSRDDLYRAIEESLDGMLDPAQAAMRGLRTQVIGSAVTRPKLQEAIDGIHRQFAIAIANAYRRATAEGWINPGAPLEDVAMWAMSLINARTMIEIGPSSNSSFGESWNRLTKEHVLNAIFGPR